MDKRYSINDENLENISGGSEIILDNALYDKKNTDVGLDNVIMNDDREVKGTLLSGEPKQAGTAWSPFKKKGHTPKPGKGLRKA